ncbi:unnamed protein product [Lupinus luteus]|uniref:RING-type domain-containing protein n=1 Tax=Lupinus luteus TaxID=3873 RepID=A0AAV1Y6B3_LUPLU
MGFDNECIVNIQSLAGEYFCPVCRLLVYPNEALQSQCTHLYCKPCLAYVVSTTKACPYDGYLVTEADSKPLMESNKALAETIGKIAVHCLYHRSGCTWQGTLSECTSHCSVCAFGNSPVVCNRCAIQIVHRQVQEHAQNCPGVQGQVQPIAVTQDPSASSTIPSTDQNQTAAVATASQSLTSQTVAATATPGQVSNQLPNSVSKTQPSGQTAVQPTAEQWYQQQQYQQYYQQYPGYDPYQQQYQQYYPYQQPVVPQYQQAYGQPQPQPQVQAQPQSQPHLQTQPQTQGQSQPLSHAQSPLAPQSQNQMQVHHQQQLQPVAQPHSQIPSLTHPPGPVQTLPQSQPYPYPQVQPHAVQPQPQQNMQMPAYQQPHTQMQHSQHQIQQPGQKYATPQPQPQPHAPGQHISQPHMHPQQSLTPNAQPQVPNTSSHAVTGHHSYPQFQPNQNMQPGVPQHTMQTHPQSGPQSQAQHLVQMQNQFPQQISMMRPPHQSSAMFPNQQQSALVPSPVRGQTTAPLQQQLGYTHNHQPEQINRPVLQPGQQTLPQQPFAQHQILMPPHLRPQGPAHSVPRHSYPQSQGNAALSNSTQHSQSQNATGRPLIPNHPGQVQPFAQSASTFPVRPGQASELQSRTLETVGRQGDIIEPQTDPASGKANELNSEKVETDMKSVEVGNKQNGENPHAEKTVGTNANALKNGDLEAASVQNDSNDHSVVKVNEIQDGPLKTETKLSESKTDKLRNDDISNPIPPATDKPAPAVSQIHGSQGTDIDQYRSMQSGVPMNNYGPGAVQQRSHLPHPDVPNQPFPAAGHSSNLLNNHAPAHPPHLGQQGRNFQPQSLGPSGPYDQGNEPPFHASASNLSRIGGPHFGAMPPGDMRGGLLPPHGPRSFGFHDERFKSFSVPGQLNINQGEFEDDLRKVPRLPLDADLVSQFGNYSSGPHETGKRPAGFHEDATKKSGSALHSGYLGPDPGYGRHQMDGMTPRSPVGEYPEMSSWRSGPLSGGHDDFDGRALNRYGRPVGPAFHDSRFPHMPSHLHGDEFDGFGNFRTGRYPRNDNFMGQDEFAGHFRRGEHLDPHKFPRHLHLEDPIGFGAHPGHMRAVEISGSRSFSSFSKGNRPGHPQLGEPGFRSRFSLPGFPNDAGHLPGDIRSFDNLSRRKAASMGWCRICKVDCETVEGLDLHSQTIEHQKTTMDMVKSIKQNVKRQKIEQSSVEDGSKSRNAVFEGSGNKH